MGSLAIALYTQEVAGYSATVAGLATLPSPILSFLFARRIGALAARIGPRIFVTTGPVLAGFGLLLIRPSAHGFNIFTHLLPGMIVLACGLVLTITPLTALNLSAVDPAHSGIAAAIQNAVGRLSALVAVASVGLIAACNFTEAMRASPGCCPSARSCSSSAPSSAASPLPTRRRRVPRPDPVVIADSSRRPRRRRPACSRRVPPGTSRSR